MHISAYIFATFTFALLACSGSDFKSKTNRAGNQPLDEEAGPAIALPCPTANDPLQVAAPKKGRFALKGTVCPKGVGNLDITFIVDFSQSMQFPAEHVAKFGPGSDPVTKGSCGRLDAAKSIVKLMSERAGTTDEVTFTSVPFSDDFVSDKSFGPVSLKDVEAKLTVDNFCGTILYTNYAAGFKAAREKLNLAKGRVPVIYFITDGKPLIAKTDSNGKKEVDPATGFNRVDEAKAAADGIKEAAALIASSPEIRLYSLFLSKNAKEEAAAVSYLRKISTKEEYVKPVKNAVDLANEIVKFLIPNLALDINHTTATLDEKAVKIVSLVATPENQNIWEYLTEALDVQKATQTFNLQTKTAGGTTEVVNATITAP